MIETHPKTIQAAHWQLAAAVCAVLAGCAGGQDEGTFAVSFKHPDGAKTDGSLWVAARIVEGRARRVVVEAAMQPLLPKTTLGFSEVPYGTSYRVLAELRNSTDREQPVLYWGESGYFDLARDHAVEVEVPMALGPGPEGSTGDPGPIAVIEAIIPDSVDLMDPEALYLNKTLVTLSLGATNATRVVVAHDTEMKIGRQERDVADLTPSGKRLLWTKWDLCKELQTEEVACPTGLRGVFVQYLDALGHFSPVYSVVVNLDLDTPSVFEYDEPTFETLSNGEQWAYIKFYVDEPLGFDPVALSDPPLSLSVQRGTATSHETYQVAHQITHEEPEGRWYIIQVDITDRAGSHELRSVGRFVFDFTPPTVVVGTVEVVPAQLGTGEMVTVSFGVSEALNNSQPPTVLLGGRIVRDCMQSTDVRHYVCTHVVEADELRGVQAIAVDLQDPVGNRSSSALGQVVYDDG